MLWLRNFIMWSHLLLSNDILLSSYSLTTLFLSTSQYTKSYPLIAIHYINEKCTHLYYQPSSNYNFNSYSPIFP